MLNPPHGHQQIPIHMIFDFKFNRRKKARFEAGSHRTNDQGENAYSGVMAPEDIFGAIHNDLKVIAAVIVYTYLHAKTIEQLYTILGDDYRKLPGRGLVLDKELYGLTSSSARFHELLNDILHKTAPTIQSRPRSMVQG